MNTALRNILKKWVRPPLIPLVRWFIRYAASPFPRRLFWKTVVGPYFQCAQYDFVASTIFGSNISGNTADLIQRYIYYFGVWEPGLTDRLRVSLGEGDVFVDVGANIGYFTLQASKLVGPAGRVIAVEASPHIFRRLTGHLRLNQAENVDAHNFAASGDFGRVKMFLASAANIGQSGIFQKDGFTYECEVEAKPLSSVIPPDVSRRVRLIKIDVEGAEWSVLSGMVPLLQEPRENLEVIVEIRP